MTLQGFTDDNIVNNKKITSFVAEFEKFKVLNAEQIDGKLEEVAEKVAE